MKIKEIINKILKNEQVTSKEKNEVFHYFNHIPNIKKTNEEFELYYKMLKERNKPLPNRNMICRPLEEEYFKSKGIEIEVKKHYKK